jgi:hypothetical protein
MKQLNAIGIVSRRTLCFSLPEEFDSLKSQIAMSKAGRGGRRGFSEE